VKLHEVKSEPQNIEYRTAECRRVESLRSVFVKIDKMRSFDPTTAEHLEFDIRIFKFSFPIKMTGLTPET